MQTCASILSDCHMCFFFFKQKTAYDMRISDWSSDVCSSDLLVATWLSEDMQDYQAVRYEAPTFILIGNESQGLPEAYAAAADIRVKMPMMGKADSLNAAVAGAVMAYEVLNQDRKSTRLNSSH